MSVHLATVLFVLLCMLALRQPASTTGGRLHYRKSTCNSGSGDKRSACTTGSLSNRPAPTDEEN